MREVGAASKSSRTAGYSMRSTFGRMVWLLLFGWLVVVVTAATRRASAFATR